MAAVKTFREKMADEGLTSFIVSYDYNDPTQDDGHSSIRQFWAEDAGHAGEQFDDEEPEGRVLLVETQDEYEARTGSPLDFGRKVNR